MMTQTMGLLLATAITILTLAHSVIAHGYVPQIKIGNQYIPGWDVAKGSYNLLVLSNAKCSLIDPYTTPRVPLY